MKNRVNQTCTNAKAIGGCNHCNRSGLAFLPVRYAVARHPSVKDIMLPEDRVKAFTNIFLNELIDDAGKVTRKDAKAWYILRRLRSGYLYVYDEHPKNSHWLCYAIGENGELTQFPAGQSVLPEKVECNQSINYALAGLVALQDSKTDRTINLIFVEAPFGYERLLWMAHHPEWRAKHMQRIQLSQISSSPFCFSEKEIQKYVAEYSSISPVSILKDDLEPGKFSNENEYLSYVSQGRDTYTSLLEAFSKASGRSETGSAIIVPDAVGIIKQLDIYRLSALNDFAKDLKPGDQGAEKEKPLSSLYTQDELNHVSRFPSYKVRQSHYEFNERNYKWYLAVNKLKELMAASFDIKNQGYGKLLPPGIPEDFISPSASYHDVDTNIDVFKGKMYREARDYYNGMDERIKRRIDQHIKDENITSERAIKAERDRCETISEFERTAIKTAIMRYELDWEIEKSKSKNNIKNSEKEILNDYISWEAWTTIKKMFDDKYNESKYISICFDSDYVIWINKTLHDDLDKYDKNDPVHCGTVVEIIANVLKNGALSGASKHLWQRILLEDRNLVDRGLSLNNTVVYDDIKIAIENYAKKNDKKSFITPTGELNKELIAKIEKNAVKIRDFISKAKGMEIAEILKVKTAPLVATFNSLRSLQNTATNVASSLLVDELKNEVGKGLIKQNTLAIGFRYNNRLVEIHNFGNTINKAFYGSGFKNYVAIEVEMTPAEASRHIASLNKYLDKDTADVRHKSVKLYDNGEKVGGNYQVDENDNNHKVTMYVFTREDHVENVRNIVSKRGVDALSKDIKGLYESQQKVISKVNIPSAIVIKLGCLYSLVSAFNDYSKKRDSSSLCKLISSFIAAIQNASEVASWTLTKVAERALRQSVGADTKLISDKIITSTSKTIMSSEAAMILSKGMGHLVSLMAVYDAIKGTLEAIDIYNAGGLSEDYRNKAISTGISFISSVIVGLFISNIFVGAIVAIASIAILFFFDVNRLVPQCIQNWLRRSKFGIERDTAPGRAFYSMEEEQDALSMLLKGVVFTVSIEKENDIYRAKKSEEKTWMDYLIESTSPGGQIGAVYHEKYVPSVLSEETKKLQIKLDFPDSFDGYFELLAQEDGNDRVLLKNIYLFDGDGSVKKIKLAHDNVHGDISISYYNFNSERFKDHGDLVSIKKKKMFGTILVKVILYLWKIFLLKLKKKRVVCSGE